MKSKKQVSIMRFVQTICCAAALLWGSGGLAQETKTLEIFAGAASKPATEEAATLFEQTTGTQVLLHFGGSGKMLADMKLAQKGDIYFPGSSDYMETAKQQGLVKPETEARIVYLLPAINVPKGNPAGIRSLKDLARPGLRLGIARPDMVCVGVYAVEVLEKNGLAAAVRPNIKVHVESCAKVAQLAALGMVDAVIGWRVFSSWNPDKIETIALKPAEIPRIGYIPVAVSSFSKHSDSAAKFIAFLQGDQCRAIFKKWGYMATEAEARLQVLPATPVGGTWELPAQWR